MHMDKFTNKFQMALGDAQSLAVGQENPFIEPVHVMQVLLNQEGGTVKPLLLQLNINVNQLAVALDEAIDKLPQVQGESVAGEIHVSKELNRLLNLSDKLAQQRKDQFISCELFTTRCSRRYGCAGTDS